ncbi:MAG: SUMF1/EgtB/PvdO family nonheme iron enzyme [Bacteroidales bacterium]|nr:SUMF1/EgtB/PvdO family nonheme iron enzyme [Bacteroidales bacterium]
MRKVIPIILSVVAIVALSISCEKEPSFLPGSYRYANDELVYIDSVETVGNFTVHWNENTTNEQQYVVREILANMVQIPAGYFYMGSQKIDSLGNNYDTFTQPNESPVHEVRISTPFYINKYEITQREWSVIMAEEDHISFMWTSIYGLGNDIAAYYLSYEDATTFISKLNTITGLEFRLPTEAEWEYAARGARRSHHTIYSGGTNPDGLAWHRGNSMDNVHAVGQLGSNEMGLYDMSGNVWEWCADEYAPYSSQFQTDPLCENGEGHKHVLRGGAWSYFPSYCRVSTRDYFSPSERSFSNGARLVLTCK